MSNQQPPTADEPDENDNDTDNEVPVEATDDVADDDSEDEPDFSELPIEDRIAKVHDQLNELPPERVGFLGFVAVLGGDEPPEGMNSFTQSTRIVGDLDAFDNTPDLLSTAVMFNGKLDDAMIELDHDELTGPEPEPQLPDNPLAALLGAGGPRPPDEPADADADE